jgi:hypothetical protein
MVKSASLNFDGIFRENINTKRRFPSVKVISGIIGRCWISPCNNREIAQKLCVSDGVISEAINNHLKSSNLIILEPISEGDKRVHNNINFSSLVEYLSSLSDFKGDKDSVVRAIVKNREAIGKSFLESFVLEDKYAKGLKRVKKLYETIPEMILFLILSLDRRSITQNKSYYQFLKSVYKSIIWKAEEEFPELTYVWSGMTWFMIDLGEV